MNGNLIAFSCAVIIRATGLLAVMAGISVAQQPPVSPGRQQVSPVATEPLTLERALELADQFNPRLSAAAAQVEGARASIVTARAYPNPQFNFYNGDQYIRLAGAAPGLMQHFSVSQPLELPRLRRARIRAAELGRESSEYLVLESRLGVRAAVKQSFFEVLRRRGEIELALQNLRLIEDLRRRIQVQVQVGEAARLELTRAEAEVATARTFARSAELRHLTALSLLRAHISAPLSASLEVRGELDTPPLLPALDTLRDEVLARHPALLQAEADIRQAQAQVDTEHAARIPTPSFNAEYERQPDLGYYRVGISLPIPLWNRREGPIAEAEARLRQANAISDLRRLEVTAELERAYGQYEVASQQVAAFQDGVLKEAEVAVQAAEAAYKFGERGIIEVLDAQRVLRTVRTDYLNAQFDRQQALIELERLRAVDLKGSIP